MCKTIHLVMGIEHVLAMQKAGKLAVINKISSTEFHYRCFVNYLLSTRLR